jgi:hypothetical protein
VAPEDPHASVCARVGLVIGAALAAAGWLLDGPRHHLVLGLVPLVGAGWIAGALVAEWSRRRSGADAVRSAELRPRRVADYVPAIAVWAARVCFAVVLAVAAIAASTASGEHSNQLTRACADGSISSNSPYPGTSYALPAAVGIGVAWGLMELALRSVSLRAPAGADPSADDERRRVAGRNVVLGAAATAVPTLGGFLVPMGLAILGTCPAPGRSTFGGALAVFGTVLLAIGGGVWLAIGLTGGQLLRREAAVR